jgi:hypothetical protein
MLRTSLRNLRVPLETDRINLIVSGGSVRNIWSDKPVSKGRTVRSEERFRIKKQPAYRGGQVVVEFDDGAFVPVYIYPQLVAVVARSARGIAAIAYAARDYEVLAQSTMAIIELTLGTLNSTKIESLAERIRSGKHANPVLGAIAAYLYRQISDFDNLRRMAYYYVRRGQPIPFDIALLAEMDIYAEGGDYFAKVPAVPRRKGEAARRNPLPKYVTRETPAVTGPLAGRCPWLTLGWDYPPGELFRDKVYQDYQAHAGLFRPSNFTCLVGKVGERLARAWKLRRW